MRTERDAGNELRRLPSTHAALVVEFVGIAGVGKTVISNKAREALNARGVPGHPGRLRRSVWLRLAVTPSFWAHLLGGMSTIMSSGPPSVGRAVVACWRWVPTLAKAWGHSMTAGIHLLDYGFFQAVRGLGQRLEVRDPSSLVGGLLHHVPLPHVVIVLEADADAIRKRRRTRSKRLGSLDLDTIERSVARLQVYKGLIERTAAATTGMTVISVENGTDQDEQTVVDSVADAIEEVLAKRGAAGTKHANAPDIRASTKA